MIKDILGDDISVQVEELDKYISKQGVIVRVSVGGGRNSYYVSPKFYGVKDVELSDDSKEFMGEHVKDGRVSFIPKEYEKKLRSIESKLKKKLRELSVGYNNTFVPLSSYPEFKEYYDKCKNEYFKVRDELLERFPQMHERFIDIAKQSINDLNAYEAEDELKKIIAKLPTQSDFANSFRVDLSVSAFPTMENIDFFDSEIKADIESGSQSTSENLVIETTINILNEIISGVSALMGAQERNGKIPPRTIAGFKNTINRSKGKNIFANSILNKYINKMEKMLDMEDEFKIEESEKLLAKIYNYAATLKIDDKLDLSKSILAEDELEDIFEMYFG